MRILIAPNAFKNSLSADEAARAIGNGLIKSVLACDCELFPIGDGGDGTADILIRHFHGTDLEVTVKDPLGRKIAGSFGWIEENKTAIIELAKASGLRLLAREEYNPLYANTAGTGQLIRSALDKGAQRIMVCIGGSATVDGALGIMDELGVKFMDARHQPIAPHPENLHALHDIDLSGLDPRILKTEWIILCDVDNFLLGPAGAASVFGPQKGAGPDAVQKLEMVLQKWQSITLAKTGKDMSVVKHGGAAGGVAAAMGAYFNANLVNGIEYFLDLTGFDGILKKSDLLITGEGSLDRQTLQGKAPFGVARRAKNKNIPVVGLAGKIWQEDRPVLEEWFDLLLSINEQTTDLQTALKNTAVNLTACAKKLGEQLRVADGNLTQALIAMRS